MRGEIIVPRWVYILLLVSAVLNAANYAVKVIKGEPEINIHIHDKRDN